MSEMKSGTLVVVYWLDIVDVDGWEDDKVAQIHQPADCVSVGWFINEDKKCIRLASSVAQDGDKSTIIIPKGCVEKIVVVKYNKWKR